MENPGEISPEGEEGRGKNIVHPTEGKTAAQGGGYGEGGSNTASASQLGISDHQRLVESWRDITRKDAELVDERVKHLDALTKLTERSEQLFAEQQNLKEKCEGEHDPQSAMVAALEEQNGLLRRIVQDKEDQITELEQRIAVFEAADPGEGRVAEAKVVTEDELADARAQLTGGERFRIDQDLLEAARTGSLGDVQKCIAQGANSQALAQGGLTLLMLASQNGNLSVVEALIRHGVNVEVPDSNGHTPLIVAARNGRLSVVEALIGWGATVNAVNSSNQTALILAAACNHLDVLTALMSSGAELNIRDSYSKTAIGWAVDKGHKATAEALREAGAH